MVAGAPTRQSPGPNRRGRHEFRRQRTLQIRARQSGRHRHLLEQRRLRCQWIRAGAYEELIIHEIGHFLSLAHTHSGDSDSDLDDWADGDGFDETLDDDADATATDINARYPGETQATRDNLIDNIMSYHAPQDIFVWDQRQAIIESFNSARDPECRGEGFFVSSAGNDAFNGRTYATRVQTLQRAIDVSSGQGNDVIMIRNNMNVPNGTVFSKKGVWLKWRASSVVIE
ncbi:MAG: M43 family zinc metalloprotease [Roseibacillus sp.]